MNDKTFFKFAEKCLFEFKGNCSKLTVLTEDLRVLRISGDVHAQRYETSLGKNALYSDPVFSHFQKVERLEKKIYDLKRIVEPIKMLRKDLKKDVRKKTMLKILELHFFNGHSAHETAKKVHVCRSVFFSTKKILIQNAENYLGVEF